MVGGDGGVFEVGDGLEECGYVFCGGGGVVLGWGCFRGFWWWVVWGGGGGLVLLALLAVIACFDGPSFCVGEVVGELV